MDASVMKQKLMDFGDLCTPYIHKWETRYNFPLCALVKESGVLLKIYGPVELIRTRVQTTVQVV